MAGILLLLAGCSNRESPTKTTEPAVIVGNWNIVSLQPARFHAYEPAQQRAYNEQMGRMLDSSYAHFNADSTYEMLTGEYLEKGRWLITVKQDKFVLTSGENTVNRFLILEVGKKSMKIQNIDTRDSVIMQLERQH
ncbi:MAG TPA: hypothetical protein VD905_18680 [Flavobacteriales bacterium]|nr:hypothetical protein [Flavobacteriales bacterium]